MSRKDNVAAALVEVRKRIGDAHPPLDIVSYTIITTLLDAAVAELSLIQEVRRPRRPKVTAG